MLSQAKLAQARNALAPYWRTLVVASLSVLGLALFLGAEYMLGYSLINYHYMLAVGALAAVALVIITIAYPFWGYAIWFFLTCYYNLFGHMFPARYNFDLNMLALIAVVLILKALVRREPRARLTLPEILLIVFYVYGYVIRRHFDFGAPVAETKLLVMSPLFYYFITKSIIKEKKHIYWLMLLIIVTGMSFALMGIYEQITGKMWLASILGGNKGLYGQMRSTGPADNYYVYGNMLILTFLLCLHIFRWQNSWYSKIIVVISSVVSLVGLYFGYSRGPYVAFVLSVLIMLLLTRYTRRVYAVFLVMTALAACILAPVLLSNTALQNRMTSNTMDPRSSVNKTSRTMFGANTWFGVGRGEYILRVQEYIARGHESIKMPYGVSTYYSRPHSEYYLMLAELGAVGFVTYFGMYLAFLLMFMKSRAKLPGDKVAGSDFAALAGAFTVGVLFTMITDEYGIAPYMYTILFTLFAMAGKAQLYATGKRPVKNNGREQQAIGMH